MNKRSLFSKVFYWLAIIVSFVNFAYIVFIHWDFILDGKGVGSFSVMWTAVYGIVTAIVWLVAFVLEKDVKLTIIYWITILAPVLLFAFLPVKFYIE